MKKYTLPKEFAEKWVAALRSGEYKQTTETLYNKDENAYCCLGVACSLQGVRNTDLIGNGEISELSNGECFDDLVDEFSIPINLIDGNLPSELIYLNDGKIQNAIRVMHPKSFSEIADWIESNVDFI